MTLQFAAREYHIQRPRRETRRRKIDAFPDEYKVPPEEMSNQNLRNHFCEPWVGCHRCEVVCKYGVEYMRRVAAGLIVPMGEGEYVRRTIR